MLNLFRFPFALIIILALFSIEGQSVLQPLKPPTTESLSNALTAGKSMPQTTLSQPLSMDLSGSKITAPAGETVSVKQGTASFSYIDSATTKTGGAIEGGSSVTLAKNGDLTAKSAGSYKTHYITIEGATGLRVSGDGAKVSFASARKMDASGFKFPDVGSSVIVSKPKGPVQTIDTTLSPSKAPYIQENPLPVRFDDATISITPGGKRFPTHVDVSRLSGIKSGSSMGITQKGGQIVFGKSVSITPIDASKPMQIQSTIHDNSKLEIEISNAYLRQRANVPKTLGPAIHEFEGRNKVSVFFSSKKAIQG